MHSMWKQCFYSSSRRNLSPSVISSRHTAQNAASFLLGFCRKVSSYRPFLHQKRHPMKATANKETPDFSSPIRKASHFFLKSALNLHSAPPPTICSTVCCSTSNFSACCCSIISSSTHPICLTASTKDGD
ncbi:hypothetical protein LWI29_016475 [Acer saccharum]|uniref:Uncharacterized protein n=1 Tax=Acer saccharum TaxID=4024 RepID=A0AA39VVX2_ACESA|nr:hypothetical protein LWI29_016475 [Acer saccharum]